MGYPWEHYDEDHLRKLCTCEDWHICEWHQLLKTTDWDTFGKMMEEEVMRITEQGDQEHYFKFSN